MVMTEVRIADLKARLSAHLRKVRAGRSLTILDRDTPIARVIPWTSGGGGLRSRAPVAGAVRPGAVRMPPPLRIECDVVELLMQERQVDR
jgi:antitoxin (DNA-binding transcriptional repressor) of toxin-antitoxin stability system